MYRRVFHGAIFLALVRSMLYSGAIVARAARELELFRDLLSAMIMVLDPGRLTESNRPRILFSRINSQACGLRKWIEIARSCDWMLKKRSGLAAHVAKGKNVGEDGESLDISMPRALPTSQDGLADRDQVAPQQLSVHVDPQLLNPCGIPVSPFLLLLRVGLQCRFQPTSRRLTASVTSK